MNTFYSRSLLLLFVLFMSEIVLAQSDSLRTHKISLSAGISEREIPANKTVEMKVVLTWDGRSDRFSIDNFENPPLTNFEITESGSLSRSEVKEGQVVTVKEFTFTLSPMEKGMAYVDDIVIQYSDRATDRRNFLTTKRMSVKILDPVYPKDYRWIWVTAISLLFVGGMVLGIQQLIKRSSEKKSRFVPPPVPLEDTIMEELTTIKNQNSKSYRQRLDEVVTVFRNYLTNKFNIPGEKRGNAENLAAEVVSAGVESQTGGMIKDILGQTEQLRFSGASVENDKFELIYGNIESCIEVCRKHEISNDS